MMNSEGPVALVAEKKQIEIKNEFYRYVYGPARKTSDACFYCARETPSCACGAGTKLLCGYLKTLNEYEFRYAIKEVFMEWFLARPEQHLLLRKTHRPEETDMLSPTNPEVVEADLKSTSILPHQILKLANFLSSHPIIVKNFTLIGRESDMAHQRIIYFIFAINSLCPKETDQAYLLLKDDLPMFHNMKILKANHGKPSKSVYLSILDQYIDDLKSPERLDQYYEKMVFTYIHLPIKQWSGLRRNYKHLTPESKGQLNSNLVNLVSEDNLKATPFEEYKELILYLIQFSSNTCLSQYHPQLLLMTIRDHFGLVFQEFLSQYFRENAGNEDSEDACTGIVLCKKMLGLDLSGSEEAADRLVVKRITALIPNDSFTYKFGLAECLSDMRPHVKSLLACPDFKDLKKELYILIIYMIDDPKCEDMMECLEKLFTSRPLSVIHFGLLIRLFGGLDSPSVRPYFTLSNYRTLSIEKSVGHEVIEAIQLECLQLHIEESHKLSIHHPNDNPIITDFYSRIIDPSRPNYLMKSMLSRHASAIFAHLTGIAHCTTERLIKTFFACEKDVCRAMLTSLTQDQINHFTKSLALAKETIKLNKAEGLNLVRVLPGFCPVPPVDGNAVIALTDIKNSSIIDFVKHVPDLTLGSVRQMAQFIDSRFNELAYAYDEPDKYPSIVKLCDFAIKFKLQYPVLVVSSKQAQVELYFDKMERLFEDYFIRNDRDITNISDLFHSYPKCYKSKLFQDYFYRLPTATRQHITQLDGSRPPYLLEIECERRKNMEAGFDPFSAPFPLGRLPNVLIQRIIHYFYYDTTIHVLFKKELATVSKLFFELASSVLTNNYHEDYLTPYLGVKDFTLIDIYHPFSLIKQYSKLSGYHSLKFMRYNEIERVLYDRIETLDLNLNYNIFVLQYIQMERPSKIKNIEVIVNYEVPVAKFFDLFRQSPLLERVNITLKIDYPALSSFLIQLLTLGHKHLSEINIYLNHTINKPKGLYIAPIKQKLAYDHGITEFPRIVLSSIPGYVDFNGFDQINVKFLTYNEKEFPVFYARHFSELSSANPIQFSISTIEPTVSILKHMMASFPLFTQIVIRIYHLPVPQISVKQVQEIFKLLSSQNRIKSFALFQNIYLLSPKTPVISRKLFQSVKLGSYQTVDYINFTLTQEHQKQPTN